MSAFREQSIIVHPVEVVLLGNLDATRHYAQSMTSLRLPAGNQDIQIYIVDSIKVTLGVGNWALESYCLVVTQVNHCTVP